MVGKPALPKVKVADRKSKWEPPWRRAVLAARELRKAIGLREGRVQQDILLVAVLTAALAGAAVGFLFYNFNPARIFMGDTGSMFLGFMLAGISIIGAVKSAATIALIVPILALGLPAPAAAGSGPGRGPVGRAV